MDGLNLQQLFSQLPEKLLGPSVPYQYFSVGVLWISSLILGGSVLYKILTYMTQPEERASIKKHPVETLSMTAVIVVIFNVLQFGKGAFPGSASLRLSALIFGSCWVILGLYLHLWSKAAIGHFWSNQIEQASDHRY